MAGERAAVAGKVPLGPGEWMVRDVFSAAAPVSRQICGGAGRSGGRRGYATTGEVRVGWVVWETAAEAGGGVVVRERRKGGRGRHGCVRGDASRKCSERLRGGGVSGREGRGGETRAGYKEGGL